MPNTHDLLSTHDFIPATATQERAEENLALAKSVILQNYLSDLPSLRVVSASDEAGPFDLRADVRIFRVKRLVQENRQAVIESATAAYAALGAAGASVFFFLDSDDQETRLFIGVRGKAGKVLGQRNGQLLLEVFKGHFPGSALEQLDGNATDDLAKRMLRYRDDEAGSVTAVVGVPALSSDNRDHFIQGLERFIDAAEGKKYQALILADPVPPEELDAIRAGCERLATLISPMVKKTLAYNQSESLAVSESITRSLSMAIGKNSSSGYSHSTSESSSVSGEEWQRSAARAAVAASVQLGLTAAAFAVAGPAGAMLAEFGAAPIVSGLIPQKTITTGQSTSKTTSWNEGTSISHTASDTEGTSQSSTGSLGVTQTREQIDKSTERLVKAIDYRLERLDEARSYGGWNAAAYFIADTQAVSEALASIFLGLLRGARSGQDNHAIANWTGAKKDKVLDWLGLFQHPRLSAADFPGIHNVREKWVSPTVMLSGREAAMLLNLPRHSTSGLAVLRAEPFGRAIQHLDGEISAAKSLAGTTAREALSLGAIRHLWEDLPQRIDFALQHLRSHTFVTGSTGAGKSNALYLMLDQLHSIGIPFLVIEPAKGEYARVFGSRNGIRVFDGGGSGATGLRIDPFRFPAEIHLLEHVDRLTSIFSVCWPLEAAMPALLKDAALVSYEDAGWDVDASLFMADGEAVYPTFKTLLSSLEKVIASEGFGERLQGEYLGSLCARVRSLTNGLSGRIFTPEEMCDTILFDETALVDLSRIGSAETKALIMGFLVTRLVEYRQAKGEMNAPLRHVTVLEEAHNILRNTTPGGSDGEGRLIGKSVEMLTDAIAEMRTYGEGFIIVDQSPRAVSSAAIRNTGTKIALRLPDEGDRRIFGKSVGLRDEQIDEIARLPNGVGVVHQAGWLEAVLCHLDFFKKTENSASRTSSIALTAGEIQAFRSGAARLLLRHWLGPAGRPDVGFIRSVLPQWPVTGARKAIEAALWAYEAGEASGIDFFSIARSIGALSGARRQIELAAESTLAQYLNEQLARIVRRYFGTIDPRLCSLLSEALLRDWAGDNARRRPVVENWRDCQDGNVDGRKLNGKNGVIL